MKIYLDTNIFDNLTKQDHRTQWTEKLFSEIENGKFEAYYSQTVIEEILFTNDRRQKEILKKVLDEKILIKRCVNQLIRFDWTKVHKLVDAYSTEYRKEIVICGKTLLQWKGSKFSKIGSQDEDRFHIAIAAINKMDALVTWNTKEYIDRQDIKDWINKVNTNKGYLNIDFFTPRQLIEIKGGFK